MRALKWEVGSALLALATSTLLAAPGTITTTLTHRPIQVGDQFTVTMRIMNYTDATEIDGFNFTVSYNPSLFSSVAGSFNLGGPPDPDVQWLSLPNQEAPAMVTTWSPSTTIPLPASSASRCPTWDITTRKTALWQMTVSSFPSSSNLSPKAREISIRPLRQRHSPVQHRLGAGRRAGFSGATMIVSAIGPTLGITLSGTNVIVSCPIRPPVFSWNARRTSIQ